MNVTCDKCSKRYAIADDKVRGKSVVKIRCKQCQNLITVQGLPAEGAVAAVAPTRAPAAAPAIAAPAPALGGPALGDEGFGEERTRAMPAMDLGQSWFAMVNKQQVGPFNARQLETKVKAGEISLRTYLWKQGMDGWKRASDVPELSPLLAGVSVGATATGPTTSASRAPVAARPQSAARDVAVANEVPMAEVTSRPVPKQAITEQAIPNARDFDAQTDPNQARAEAPAAGAGAQAGLGNLFDDVQPPSDEHALGAPESVAGAPGPGAAAQAAGAALAAMEAEGAAPSGESAQEPMDPFAALGEVDPSQVPPPGEATKFFIAQAGVHKRNPWWKILAFVGGGPLLIFGALFLLAQLRIVPLEVTRTAEDGTEVKESFFSAGGVSGLKDMLSGEAKRKRAEAEKRRAAATVAAHQQKVAAKSGDGPEQKERERPDEALLKNKGEGPQVSAGQLAALYGDGQKANIGPRVKGEAKAADSTTGGLDEGAAAKVVGGSQQAFQGCIEEALKRSPNMKVGKVTLTAHVGSSGTVVRAELEPHQHELSDWGKCLRDRAKRMVFPAFSGDEEAAVQIPLVVGVSVQ